MPIEVRDHAHGQVVLGRHGVCVCQCREIRGVVGSKRGISLFARIFFHTWMSQSR